MAQQEWRVAYRVHTEQGSSTASYDFLDANSEEGAHRLAADISHERGTYASVQRDGIRVAEYKDGQMVD